MAGYQWGGSRPAPRPAPAQQQEPSHHIAPYRIMRYHPLPADLERPTERELEVIRFVAFGFTNAQIAAKLVVSNNTVKTHILNATTKLKARGMGRAGVVGLCFRYGLITPDQVWPGRNGSHGTSARQQ